MKNFYKNTDKEFPLEACYEFSDNKFLLVETLDGKITLSNLSSLIKYLKSDINYSDNLDLQIDLRVSEITLLCQNIPKFIEIFNSFSGENRKLALVTNPSNYQMLNTILLVNKYKLNLSLKLFKSPDRALSWLGNTSPRSSVIRFIKNISRH